MEIRWKSEDVIFDTLRESEEWADSISNEIYGRTIDGYITSDYKIAYALSFFLAAFPSFLVHTKKSELKESIVYKVWVEENSMYNGGGFFDSKTNMSSNNGE